ncbi:Monooxygenase [Akanthomyces lecanii RCEF 1005]|uniref:Monooxygenase n=1 Tax=Akanthomyces lecanii RCEF 1005 TaxID=1081108 RepID=A0A168IEE5_CORDF|nr:Monooxygenase [Akanthomyces lecanii RCEF 1005]
MDGDMAQQQQDRAQRPQTDAAQKTRVAIIGSGLAGLATAHLLHNDRESRFNVALFEQAETLSLDAASVTLKNATTGVSERVNIPPRSVTRGYYPNLTQMYDHLRIPLRSVRYTFLYAEIQATKTKSGPRQPQSTDPRTGTYFAFEKLYKPVLSSRGNGGWVQQLWQTVFLAACYLWFIASCFLIEPQTNQKSNTSESLRAYLRRIRIPRRFVDCHLLPALGAICTCSHEQLYNFPASDVINFMTRSALQKTYMTDGVHNLQSKLIEGVEDIRLSARVRKVERVGNGVLIQWDRQDGSGSISEEVFDRVVLAVTPNVAANIFAPSSYALASIPTAPIEATVIDPSSKRISVEERGQAPSGRLFSQHNHPQLMAFRTHFSDAVVQTEAWNYLPSGAICRTSPYPYTSEEGTVLHTAHFTRTLRTVESRSIVQRIVCRGDRPSTGRGVMASDDGSEKKGRGEWVNGRDNVWVTGSWCWDGMVLLEGCVVSAMRVADEFDVEVPWRKRIEN